MVKIIIVCIIGFCLIASTIQSPYSLQPAIDALKQREAQLELRKEALETDGDLGEENWNDEFAVPSVFRERDRLSQGEQKQQSELADQFLKAIDHERENERQDMYTDRIHKLWDSYQRDEDDIERDLFNLGDYEDEGEELDDSMKKRKRQMMAGYERSPYWLEKKRNYPMLPWLPATRKKRFPIAKRSSGKYTPEEIFRSSAGTNDKVAHDLKEVFGDGPADNDDDKKKKKKRSNEEVATILELDKKDEHKMEKKNSEPPKPSREELEHEHVPSHQQREKENEEDDDDEEEDEDDPMHDHSEEEDDDDNEDDDKKKKKKKRGILKKRSSEEPKSGWSDVFGFDRRKKSLKRSYYYPRDIYELYRKRKRQMNDYDLYDETEDPYDESYDDEDDEEKRRKRGMMIMLKRRKRMEDEEKLDEMEEKLKGIQNLILQDTLKYTGAHEGTLDPDQIQRIKTHVANRLSTAYNVEKMRRAIEKLKHAVDFQKEVEGRLLDDDDDNDDDMDDDDDKKRKRKVKRLFKAKRVAVKKEKADFENRDHEIEEMVKKIPQDLPENDLKNDDDKKKKRKEKKSSEIVEPLSESFMGGPKSSDEECPILDAIERRCRGIDILTGDMNQYFLQNCGYHQLCYLCGTSQSSCDYQYLRGIDNLCGDDNECQSAARSALLIMRKYPGPNLGPKECSRNPCLIQALRSIGE